MTPKPPRLNELLGPRFKLIRAMKHIELLQTAQEEFRKPGNCEIVRAEFNSKTGKYVYRVRMYSLPDIFTWSIGVGEVAHNLRSALDGLVYQLALLKTKTPAGNTQFPIFLVGRTTRKMRGRRRELIAHFEGMRRGDGRSMIRSLRKEHQTAIERLQPYKRRGEGHGRRNPLYLLKEVNNADKHRLVQIVGAAASSYAFRGIPIEQLPSQVLTASPSRFGVFKDGAKVYEAPQDVYVDSDTQPYIAFWDGCEAVKGLPVIFTLVGIAKHVHEIIECFAPEFGDTALVPPNHMSPPVYKQKA